MAIKHVKSEFIVAELPNERVINRVKKIATILLIALIGIAATSFVNYQNQVAVQQIDIAQRALGSVRRLQMSKQARLTELMKYTAIAPKASPLGFTGSTVLTQKIAVPAEQFDQRLLAVRVKSNKTGAARMSGLALHSGKTSTSYND